MGKGSYDTDEGQKTRAIEHVQRVETFTYRGVTPGKVERSVHPLLDASGRVRECVNRTPVVIALDVTRSRGKDSKFVYDDLPLLVRDLRERLQDVAISFAAIGDASAGDKAPAQISQFEADNRLDEALRKFWIEEGGGGTGEESYELVAYYYARHTFLHCLQEDRKGYFFFLGDEAPYSEVNAQQVKRVLGYSLMAPVSTPEIFAELQEKFHVFFICPQSTREQRRADIDAEMRQRVTRAGGRYEGVDIRASLLWNDRNDLDLSMITPRGERIYFNNKRSSCGGWLDVDMNVTGETNKPVENIQWRTGTAPAGCYRVCVQNYRYHETNRGPIEFRAELEVNGEVRQMQETISPKRETGQASEMLLWEFDFDPARGKTAPADPYANYDDNVILQRWRGLLPASHILRVPDPRSITEVILGVIAVTAGDERPEDFIRTLGNRCRQPKQTEEVLTLLHSTWTEGR